MTKLTFADIAQQVEGNGGVATFKAQVLREAQGAGRLTERINSDIQRSLLGLGLATVPREAELMPTNQWEPVRVYKVNSEVGKVIDAVLTRDSLDRAQAADTVIVNSVSGNAAALLQKVRDLLADDS
ncbi:hypothetical protein [Nocardia sp. NPDC019255]|uniref:hypothetical protein n=1 Tax=Nocardia sp. NPDC019255 TaxID=3154591 RepID=UPI0033FCDB72